jgi:enoyl-CoA hydratase/carnithine racemase
MASPREITERDRQRIETQLRYEHEPRWMKRDIDRIARVDEAALTKQVRDAEDAMKADVVAQHVALLTDVAAQLEAARRSLHAHRLIKGALYRQADHARRAVSNMIDILKESVTEHS